MRSALKLFLKEVELGKNETAIQKYIQLIRKELGIDNSLLIEREELHVTVNQEDATEKNEYIDRYNYGSALLKIGRYEDALKILKEAEDLGDEHPWLFYNLGVCFLKFEEIEMACHYFQKSGSLGENLEEEIKKICFTE
jgi:tetratricopeptide (TPR) repeat protein